MSATLRLPVVLTLALLSASLSGCGSQETASTTPPAAKPTPPPAAAPAIHPSEQVVAQFLDRVRRGDQSQPAAALLTETARTVLRSLGREVMPIGTPESRFEVTRSSATAAADGSPSSDDRLVHTIWTEPAADGSTSQYQVVWAVIRQSVGWRISGLAMEPSPGEEMVVMDFENPEAMAAVFGIASTTGNDRR